MRYMGLLTSENVLGCFILQNSMRTSVQDINNNFTSFCPKTHWQVHVINHGLNGLNDGVILMLHKFISLQVVHYC